jgi:hypothetical protein
MERQSRRLSGCPSVELPDQLEIGRAHLDIPIT